MWGFVYLILLLCEKMTGLDRKASIFSRIYTLFFVMLAWVLFKAENIEHAYLYIKSMFGLVTLENVGFSAAWYLDAHYIFILVLACFGATPVGKQLVMVGKEKISATSYAVFSNIASLMIMGFAIIYMMTSTYNPFIYFQF